MQSPHYDPSSLPSQEIRQNNNTSTMQLPRDMLYFTVSYIIFMPFYFTNYRWIPAGRQHASLQVLSADSLNRILDVDASMFQSSMRQWRLTVDKMVSVLNIIRAGSALTLPCVPLIMISILVDTTQPSMTSATIALFLQPSVLDYTFLRASTASSFLLSGASIASASVLVALKDRILSMHKRDQWIDASTHPKKWSSIGFWGCLTWPFTSLAWSIAISIITILLLGLVGQPNPTNANTSKMGIESIVVIFSVVTVICFAFYQQFRFLVMY